MSVTAVNPTASAGASATAAPASAATGSGAGAEAFNTVLASLRNGGGTAAAGSSGATASGSGSAGSGANAAAASGSSTGTATASGKTTSNSETEDRFLKLLVAQMNNQDPLNPLDNAQVTTQLAQINTVKGIDQLNQSLQKLVDRGQTVSASEAASMAGRSVLVEGDTLELVKDGVAKAGFELAGDATSVRIEVLDRDGKVVDTETQSSVKAGLHTFEWDGTVAGKAVDPGRYRLRVSATGSGGPIGATPLAAVPVQAVVRGADGVVLQLGAAGSRPLDQVKAIL